MYPYWEDVVAPVIRAVGARRIVEIGALRGDTTVRMLDELGPTSELHVIDPVPAFDPGEHERRFPGRYVFHRDLSLNVLPRAQAFDVALVDGDHNWYTVYNELRLLREAARREDRALPLLVLHDVLWPYGRRDLYYEPSQIPSEYAWIINANPMTHLLEAYRSLLIDGSLPDLLPIAIVAVVSLVLTRIGLTVYRRFSRTFVYNL